MDLSKARIFHAKEDPNNLTQICTRCGEKFNYWVLPPSFDLHSYNLPCGCRVGTVISRVGECLTEDEVAYLMLRAP